MLSFKEYILENGGGGPSVAAGNIMGSGMPDKGTKEKVINQLKNSKKKIKK